MHDVVDGDLQGEAIRPNMLIALALAGHRLLTIDQKRAVFETARRQLYTPFGIRTLSPEKFSLHWPLQYKMIQLQLKIWLIIKERRGFG